jgi:hypothetical protein
MIAVVVQVDDENEATAALLLAAVIRCAPGLDELVRRLERLQLARRRLRNSSGSSSALTMDAAALYFGGGVHSRLTGWSW